MTPWTEQDFSTEEWDALCRARKHGDVRSWFRLLRSVCGYTQGRTVLLRQIEQLVDDWLQRHPSWTGRFL